MPEQSQGCHTLRDDSRGDCQRRGGSRTSVPSAASEFLCVRRGEFFSSCENGDLSGAGTEYASPRQQADLLRVNHEYLVGCRKL